LSNDILPFFEIQFFNFSLHCIIELSQIWKNYGLLCRRVTRAVGERSAQIIIAHNHPSGEVTPSEDDLVISKRLVKVGEILGIELIDHLVVTTTGFTSFKKKGLI